MRFVIQGNVVAGQSHMGLATAGVLAHPALATNEERQLPLTTRSSRRERLPWAGGRCSVAEARGILDAARKACPPTIRGIVGGATTGCVRSQAPVEETIWSRYCRAGGRRCHLFCR